METEAKILQYLHDRDRSKYRDAVWNFNANGVPTPKKFGESAQNEMVPEKPASNAAEAKAIATIDALKLAEADFDAVIADVTVKAKRRSDLKLMAAVISALSSSSLLGLLGSSNASGPWSYAAAALALLSSLISILQDYVGVRTSTFWDSLAKASHHREAVANLIFQLSIALKGSIDGPQADTYVQSAATLIAELRTLMQDMHIEALKS